MGAANLKRREEAWLYTRKIGYLSFIFPVSIILIILKFWANDAVYNRIYPIAPGSVWMTAVYFMVWFVVEIGLNLFKWWLCRHVFGMSAEHFDLIVGPRDKWTLEEIEMLEKTYGMFQLKKMDATYRRAGHIIVNMWRIYYYIFLVDNTQRLQVAIMQTPVIFCIKKSTEFTTIGNFVFQGCRIRDGQFGRFNQVVVNFWAYCARIIMMIMLAEANYDNPTNRVLISLAMQPLIWGDTFGEVIGSFFGRYEFNVLGIGEVNKKTVEGTIAVFISSLVALYLTYYLVKEEGIAMFKYDYNTVFFYTAFLCTIVEVGAPRSTDNFFLQTCGLFILLNSFNSSYVA